MKTGPDRQIRAGPENPETAPGLRFSVCRRTLLRRIGGGRLRLRLGLAQRFSLVVVAELLLQLGQLDIDFVRRGV